MSYKDGTGKYQEHLAQLLNERDKGSSLGYGMLFSRYWWMYNRVHEGGFSADLGFHLISLCAFEVDNMTEALVTTGEISEDEVIELVAKLDRRDCHLVTTAQVEVLMDAFLQWSQNERAGLNDMFGILESSKNPTAPKNN